MQFIKNSFFKADQYDGKLSKYYIAIAFIISLLLASQVALGLPTGATLTSRIYDFAVAIGLNIIVFFLFVFILAIIFSFLFIPLPRFALAAVIYVGLFNGISLNYASAGLTFSILIGILTSVFVIILALIIYGLTRSRTGKYILSITLAFGLIYIVVDQVKEPEPSKFYEADADSPTIRAPYETTFFTYGSGRDTQRDEFNDVHFQTNPADASHFITKWSDDRRSFWNFGPENFPINGRAFMPQGEGPFPVVLMVHGNHTMEYFSTAGYDYLGELLAARGFFFVSVDQDFVNYSNHTGQPNDNYKLRTWLLLKHLVSLKEMNEDPSHPLYGKLDFEKVAVGGHSRGGQAAAMAANYQAFFDEDDDIVEEMNDINIDAVIALSPTDKQVDNKRANLFDTNYIVLHGAQDADVYSFRGDLQYGRTDFDPNEDKMKASIYIEHANHVQFNTDWGKDDLSQPRGLYLNRLNYMNSEDQRQIAKAYISAFLEKVFHNDDSYDPLFMQDESTQDWLPDKRIVAKYLPSTYKRISSYSEINEERMTFSETKKKQAVRLKNRSGQKYLKKALEIDFHKELQHTFTLRREDLFNMRGQESNTLVLTMANGSPNTNIKIKGNVIAGGESKATFEKELAPVIEIDTTWGGLLDNVFRDGKYEKKWDIIFETIHIPIDDLKPGNINEAIIDLEFETESEGTVYIQEIGVY